MGVPVLLRRFLTYGATNIDEIIGDHAESDPALHSVFAFVPTTVEPVSPLGHADAALAAGPPILAVTEPALLFARAGAQHSWWSGWCATGSGGASRLALIYPRGRRL